jgi:single-strand selective monofunctional uracil DNA glycosylase
MRDRSSQSSDDGWTALQRITDDLVNALEGLRFGPPVTHVYNPLIYARRPWDEYCRRFGAEPREILLLGMNPGPYGMAQVGVPFGEVSMVRDWLGISGPVGKPSPEHPKRPVLGFDCPRSEVSGARLWGWARDRFGTPDAFFARFFVANYCPLVFMGESGVNITPDKLPAAEREPLYAACDFALRETVELLAPKVLLGVGKFAESRMKAALGEREGRVIAAAPHPSPASPIANRGWAALMDLALAQAGVRVM